MDFEAQDFGIISTDESVNIDSGNSGLFSDPKEVEKIIEPTKPKEEEPDNFSVEPSKSSLFTDDEEEVEEKTTEPEPTTIDVEEPKQEEDHNIFKDFSKDLVELGLFIEEEEEFEIDSPEKFAEKFKKDVESHKWNEINKFLGKFGQSHIDAFNALYINGVDPETYFKSQIKIETIEGLDLTQDDNQKLVVRNYYSSLGWAEDKIQKKIEKLVDYGDLEEEASVASEKLLQHEKKQQQEEVLKKQQEIQQKQQQEEYYQNSLYSILQNKVKTKDFDGIPVTDKTAKETFDFMTNRNWRDKRTGEEFSDFDKFLLDLKAPENYELAVKVALLAKNGLDLSKVKQKAVTQETNKLFQTVQNKQKTSPKRALVESNDNFQF